MREKREIFSTSFSIHVNIENYTRKCKKEKKARKTNKYNENTRKLYKFGGPS